MRKVKINKFTFNSLTKEETGSTMMNLMVAMGLIGILSAIAVPNLKIINNPLNDASILVSHFLKLTRSRAISETKSLKVSASSATRIKVEQSTSCNGTFTPHPNLFLNIPKGALLVDTSWSVCFTPRGLADNNILFSIQNLQGKIKSIEVALGGGNQIKREL